MQNNRYKNLSKEETITYYIDHKYRKCNGYFDALVRGSVNRDLRNILIGKFLLTEEDMILIDQEIDKKFGRI